MAANRSAIRRVWPSDVAKKTGNGGKVKLVAMSPDGASRVPRTTAGFVVPALPRFCGTARSIEISHATGKNVASTATHQRLLPSASGMTQLEIRLAAVERQLRIARLALVAAFALLVGTAALPAVVARQTPADVRTRNLVIEDENGRPRIRLGAPLSGSGTPRTGLPITDTRGFERLGLNLFDDGRMVVGIDAPPPTSGQVGNLERINLVAD